MSRRVLSEETLHGSNAEESSTTNNIGSERVAEKCRQLPTEPSSERHAEAFLPPAENFGWNEASEGALEDVFGGQPT